jgi:SAM-dependent methyltransferase
MNPLQKIFTSVSQNARRRRLEIFRGKFKLDETKRVLDIGSENGSNIKSVLEGTGVTPQNIYLADIDEKALADGHRNFGFNSVLYNESDDLPFADQAFDVVYCSSVIEHATIPKIYVWQTTDEEEFKAAAWQRQKRLADEIRRVGKAYFVQTPNRAFPVESHSLLPFAGSLPRPLLIKVLEKTTKFWVSTEPDFNLLDASQMQELFPEAEIVPEKKFGLVKSLMAIKI